MASDKKSVLFICLGNICRSPIAEAIFAHMVKEKGLQDKWHIDSAGTADYHIGKRPDKRALQCLKSHSIETAHRCREITQNDFKNFDIIFGMDDANMSDLEDLAPSDATAQLKMLGEYDPKKELVIEDPYYGNDADFETVYQQCWRCCEEFLKQNS